MHHDSFNNYNYYSNPELIKEKAIAQKNFEELSTKNLRREIQKLRRRSIINN